MSLRNIFLVCVFMFPSLVLAWPWSTDMMNQPSIKPQEPVNGKLFAFPKRSIPVTGIPTQVANRDEAKGLQNPIPVSQQSLKLGKRLFVIYCSACHGISGKADYPISPKMGAMDLTSDYVQQDLTEGWIWGTISFGSVIMPAYGVPGEGGGSNDLSPEERWHVVNYVRNGLLQNKVSAK